MRGSKYTPVSLAQFDFLRLQAGWHLVSRGNETVKEKRYSNGVVIRVFTTIRKGNSCGRGYAQDAIRVVCFHSIKKRGLAKTSKVLRTQGWQERVKDHILNLHNKFSPGAK